MQDPKQSTASSDLLLIVAEQDEGQRLDAYLSHQLGQCSRSQLKKLIQEGDVLVNGTAVKPRHAIRPGDEISVRLPVFQPDELLMSPQSMPLDILFEDDNILVVNKAPGIVVHPGAGCEQGTLVHGLLAHSPQLAIQGAPRRPGIVHRLDRDTSGALVVAKSERAYLHLIDQFKQHQVAKEYLALVYGAFDRSSGEIRSLLGRHPVDRKKIAVVEKGREAITRWQVRKQWNGSVTLLSVVIETGRTHQIRVHLSHINRPVVGDGTYGGGKHRARSVSRKELRDLLLQVDRQMLHAWHLAFLHPISSTPLHFEAPLPHDFDRLLKDLDRVVAKI